METLPAVVHFCEEMEGVSMKKRMLSIGLVLSFLLALCPLPVALAADLSGAEVTVEGVPLEYNGKAQEPEVTVTLDGKTLTRDADYTLKYENNTNAGQGTVTVKGKGVYDGTTSSQFTILPYTLKAEDFAGQEPCIKTFGEGTKAEPKIQTTVFGETVEVKYDSATYESRFVGNHKVTVSGLSVNENYQLGFDSLTMDGQILSVKTELSNGEVEVGKSLDLTTLVINGKSAPTFDMPDNEEEKLGATLSGTILTAGSQTGTIAIWVIVDGYNVNNNGEDTLDEYTGVEGYLTVTITEPKQEDPPPVDPPITQKQPQEPLVISGAKEITYGRTLQLSCSGGSTNGTVTWELADIKTNGEATISPSGLLTPVKAGTVWVTATMAGNDTYEEVTATTEITIRQAPITITVADKSALVGEETPALTDSDYTVTGLVGSDQLAVLPTLSYETTPDMTKEGQVAIQASGAAVPAGGNYDSNINYVSGKLTIGPTYPITITQVEGGTVTADVNQAAEGATVTLQVKPEKGFVLDAMKVESGSMVVETAEAGEGAFTFTMPDGGVVITPAFVPEVPQALPFTDVTEGDWFYESVAYVYTNGLMNGTSDTTFSPNGTTTRGMIVTILYRQAGSPEAAAWSPFQDVDPNQYYAAPIAWAAWNGIVNGKTATSFGPNDPITREQMAAILYRYAKDQGMDVSQRGNLAQFSDQGRISTYAREALSWANGAGLITGKGGGVLDPQGPAVRAQVAAIFQRFCESTTR